MKIKKALKMLSALSHETRLNIFKILIQEGSEGLSAGALVEIIKIPPATLSFHLTQMTNADLISASKSGRNINYSLKYKSTKKLFKFLHENSYYKSDKENKFIETEKK